MQHNDLNRMPRSDAKEAPENPPVLEKPLTGVVTDCLRLNVRQEPDRSAKVVTVIDCLSQVTVDPDGSAKDFYKVRTSDGIEGFCMKKYIQLRRWEGVYGDR